MKIKDFKLERFFAKYEFNTKYLLCSSDCESRPIKDILRMEKGASKEFRNLNLGYTESQGDPALREEISKFYSNLEPKDILVFSGAEEGIFTFMNVLLDKGDNIIVHSPSYQSLSEIARSAGCSVTNWNTSDEENWELDMNFLEKNIKPNTKAIVVNSPHNPTGYQMSRDKYLDLKRIAKDNDIHVFSDEVYKFLEQNEGDGLPSMCDLYDKGVCLNVMSKTFGLAGLRIGWLATKDSNLLEKMASFKDFTSICNSAPSEYLARIALKNKDKLLKRNKKIIKGNLLLLDDFFDKHSDLFSWVKPKAGPICLPRIKNGLDSEDFCIDVVNKKNVLLLPSTLYDFGNEHFRIGYGRKNMPEALGKFEEYIEENL